jgi:hypothetical protein
MPMKSLGMIAAGLLALACVAVQADEIGTRKAGEWEVTVTGRDGKAGAPQKFCFGQGKLDDALKHMESCSRHDIGRSGNTATIDAVCTLHGQQITMHVAITAASENAYHSEMHSTMSPGSQWHDRHGYGDGRKMARSLRAG